MFISISLQTNIFSADMRAVADLWIIGNKQATDGFRILQQLRNKTNISENPCIYTKYKVFFYAPQPNPLEQNPLKMLVNTMIEAFNRNIHLPRYLIIMLV